MKSFLRKTVFYRIYKKSIAKLAVLINWNPSENIFIIWITWTDWKTTTCNILHKIMNDNLWKTLCITTNSIKIWEKEIENNTKMTSFTPFALQKILYDAKKQECKYAVLEVSSHWIDQYRFEWIDFDMGVLTNITAEHLDYHETFENYLETKKKFFKSILINSKEEKLAVLPKDDKTWRVWYEEIWFDRSVDFWIITNAWIKAEDINLSYDKTHFNIKYLWHSYQVKTNLPGKFNIYNALAALSAWIMSWIWINNIIKSIQDFLPPSGRMEYIPKNDVHFFVDFAHTPNSLESVLSFLKELNEWKNRIICVFWAPGNRDKFKRPEMWKVVEKYSDSFIITDDDPDTENRINIINDICKWVSKKLWQDYFIIPDRAKAIEFAWEISQSWDIILLAWKWHEQIQLTNFGKIEWNDKEFVNKLE